MNISHIEHIGIAVNKLDEAIPYYENVLGLKCYAVEEVADQKVKTAFFMVGQTKIELLESTDPEGPIGKFLEKKGEGIHHIAFEVENIQQTITEKTALGFEIIHAQPKDGADNKLIAFFHPKSTGSMLTEICQEKD